VGKIIEGSLDNIGLVFIWQEKAESLNKLHRIVKERCDDTETKNVLPRLSEKICSVLYCDRKLMWCWEGCIECCNRIERAGQLSQYSVWLRTGQPGDRGSIPGRGERIFPLTSVSRPALGPTQPHVQWIPGVLSPEVKRGRGMTLTTHPHLVPRSRMSRSCRSSPRAPA
jgi:hypothetical protein